METKERGYIYESTAYQETHCKYIYRHCSRPALSGYDHCKQHILKEVGAPYKQCWSVTKSGHRCWNPAPIIGSSSANSVCDEHFRLNAQLQRIPRKKKCKETAKTLLEELGQYLPQNKTSAEFKHLKSENLVTKDMETLTSSESESEEQPIEKMWVDDMDSDTESPDSDQEDPRSAAGVFTLEELALLTRDKLIRLQSLYIDQFKRLQHLMKERRRDYLQRASGARSDGFDFVDEDILPSPEKEDKRKATKRYHRKFGKEALLHRRVKERRLEVSKGVNYQMPSFPKCVHVVQGVRCAKKVLPLSKYCPAHILDDPFQALYAPCECESEDCRAPVAAPLTDTVRCDAHSEVEDTPSRWPPQCRKDKSSEQTAEATQVKPVYLAHLPKVETNHSGHLHTREEKTQDKSSSCHGNSNVNNVTLEGEGQDDAEADRVSEGVDTNCYVLPDLDLETSIQENGETNHVCKNGDLKSDSEYKSLAKETETAEEADQSLALSTRSEQGHDFEQESRSSLQVDVSGNQEEEASARSKLSDSDSRTESICSDDLSPRQSSDTAEKLPEEGEEKV